MSTKPNDQERLSHILSAIDRIKRFTSKMTFSDFSDDEVTQFAVIKNFEIIGEAAYHISDELRENAPQIEWRKIMAFRHILVHDYYKINLEIVWNAKENKLDELRGEVLKLIHKN